MPSLTCNRSDIRDSNLSLEALGRNSRLSSLTSHLHTLREAGARSTQSIPQFIRSATDWIARSMEGRVKGFAKELAYSSSSRSSGVRDCCICLARGPIVLSLQAYKQLIRVKVPHKLTFHESVQRSKEYVRRGSSPEADSLKKSIV